MSKLLQDLTKIGSSLGLSGSELLNWVESKHAQHLEIERQQMEADRLKREQEMEADRLKREQEMEADRLKREQEMEADRLKRELEKERMQLEADQNRADMELKKNLEELKIKMKIDFKLQEMKLLHDKQSPPEAKSQDSTTSRQEGRAHQHTRIRVPVYKENVDDLEI
ncbi:hypothetical protein BsWGS_19818 [Bradybaena similaris]